MNTYTINFTDCKYIDDIHQTIKSSLDFPDTYRENWYDFWDCISKFTRETICITIMGVDKIGKHFNNEISTMYEMLFKYRKKFNPNLSIKLIYNDREYFM